eukprot:6286121-Prymnesium_polylepis.2
MSAELCNIFCLRSPHMLLLRGTDCYCADAAADSLSRVADSNCGQPCTGDASKNCGAFNSDDYGVLYDR